MLLQYITFGSTGLRVSPIALGTGLLGASDGTIDAQMAFAIVDRYLELGGNLIDTAEAYQGGQSETLIGEVLGSRRDDVVLVSKYARGTGLATSPGRAGGHRKAMVQSVEGSLRRLRTDRIDMYFAHLDDEVTPVDEIMRGFDDLVSAGKILYGGLSNFPAWRTALAAASARTHGWVPLSSVEVEYSLLHRTAEREILPLARAEQFAVLAYSPLAAGALAKRRPEPVSTTSRIGLATESDVDAVLLTLEHIAASLETPMSGVALKWILLKGCFPVVGARSVAHLQDALVASDIQLDTEHMRELDAASAIRMGYPHELLARNRTATRNRAPEEA